MAMSRALCGADARDRVPHRAASPRPRRQLRASSLVEFVAPSREGGAMLSTYLSFQAINRNLTTSLASTAAEPAGAHPTPYYLANIGKGQTGDGFFNNYNLFSYAMEGHWLGGMD